MTDDKNILRKKGYLLAQALGGHRNGFMTELGEVYAKYKDQDPEDPCASIAYHLGKFGELFEKENNHE